MRVQRSLVALGLAAGLAGSGVAACTAILGIDPPLSSPDAGLILEAGAGGQPACTTTDASITPGDYLAFDGEWAFYTLDGGPDGSLTYLGGCVDTSGHLYLTSPAGWVVRLVWPSGAAAPSQVEYLHYSNEGAAASFAGAQFDGQFVYVIPNGAKKGGAVIGRFDSTTDASFEDAGAWSWFDLAAVAPGVQFFGAAILDRVLYLAPGPSGAVDGGASGVVASNSLSSPDDFADASAWKTFDVSALDPQARGFLGAVADSDGVTFIPHKNNAFGGVVDTGNSGTVARLKANLKFDAAASWSTFDVTGVNGLANGFYGGAFDGRYVYLVPGDETPVVVRYDTTKINPPTSEALNTLSAWSSYDMTRVSPPSATGGGYQGAGYDGRYVYFAPGSTAQRTVVRYDTTLDFNADCAWSTADVDSFTDAGARGFAGVLFDGEYLYFVPSSGNTQLARFRARTTRAIPSPLGGSFL